MNALISLMPCSSLRPGKSGLKQLQTLPLPDKGHVIWPSPVDGVVGISASQLAYMLDGIDWRNPRHTWRPSSAG
jgi:hypothetical protein